MIKTIDGNLVSMFAEGQFDTIIHGCNCQCVMGAGIALEIATVFPEAQFADMYNSEVGDIKKLSNWTAAGVRLHDDKAGLVINLYTQFNPGNDLSLPALELGFYKLSQSLTKDSNIGIPKIGAGLAGGDWNVIEPLVEKYFKDHKLTIINYKP